MKKFFLAVVAASTLLLASCAGTGGLTPEQIGTLKEQIIAYTISLCSFQPEAATLGTIISAFYAPAEPFAMIVSSVSEAICKAPVTAAATRRGAMTLTRVVATPKGNIVVRGVTYGGRLQYQR